METTSALFKSFLEAIQITEKQREDAHTKYNGVCETLHKSFYATKYTGSTNFLFGSYKTCTLVGPMDKMQDVDVLFKIDEDTYINYQYNPSGMLQKIRTILQDTYTTTDHIAAWGKVVLVEFSEGHFNVELLPGFEQEDGTFKIPNTSNGGSWEEFNPRDELDAFAESNSATGGKARGLVQMIKKWVKNTPSLKYKSYCIMNDVISFYEYAYGNKVSAESYDSILISFYAYLENHTPSHLQDYQSQITTAKKRAVRAEELAKEGKMIEASQEWRKIFGNSFPLAQENSTTESKSQTIVNPARPWHSGK